MRRQFRYALAGALVFAAVAAGFLIWYAIVPRDQLVMLFILALPTDYLLSMFAVVTNRLLPTWAQMTGVVLSGMLQLGVIGYCIGRYVNERSRGDPA